ncbi:MAG: hypothetical protein VKO39_03385 [Cyanobacteriota bacterium]|nr:hypothetical protein [Cyanobacteriota bacterium]
MDTSIQKRWADAQQLPNDQRYKKEKELIGALIKSAPANMRGVLKGLPGQALEMLCEQGDRAGWAYVHGFTVKWHPTRGVTKHAWHLDRAWSRRQPGHELEALGPRPERCSLLQALVRGRGSVQTFPQGVG